MTVTYDKVCGINATAICDDHKFKGWNTKVDSFDDYITADTVWNYDVKEMTLYAQWADNPHLSNNTIFFVTGAVVAFVVALSVCFVKRFEA